MTTLFSRVASNLPITSAITIRTSSNLGRILASPPGKTPFRVTSYVAISSVRDTRAISTLWRRTHYRISRLSALKRRTIWQLVDGITRRTIRADVMCERVGARKSGWGRGLWRRGNVGLKTVTANGRYPSSHSITIIIQT